MKMNLIIFAIVILCVQARAEYVVPMRYDAPLQNCWLETTTNFAAGWQRDEEFTVLSNGDWHVNLPSGNKFYRVCGESVNP